MFSKNLISWYQKNSRDLPWRRTRDPYKIWVSEVMLQQTTVSAVIPYYEKWIKTFPTIKHVAAAPLDKILSAWQGLGYYQRPRNFHKAAQIICKKFHEKIPDNIQDIQELPGFGPYTTGAVLSIAFDQRVSIIDANVRRVVMRYLGIKGYADTKQDKKIKNFLEQVMPNKNMSSFNQALMEIGALICKPSDLCCASCPINAECKAYSLKIQNQIPNVKKKKIIPQNAIVMLIQKDKKFLIRQRPDQGLWAEMWEFPWSMGKEKECFVKVKQYYTQYCLTLHTCFCKLEKYSKTKQTHKWVRLEDMRNYAMPAGHVKIVKRLNQFKVE